MMGTAGLKSVNSTGELRSVIYKYWEIICWAKIGVEVYSFIYGYIDDIKERRQLLTCLPSVILHMAL